MSDKALFLGDIHLTDDLNRPKSRKPGYTEQILDKVRFAADKANELNCPIVCLGDLFHLKPSSKNSHRLVQSLHEAFGGVRTFLVVGNHDIVYDRLESIPSQPIGALAKMKNVSLLMGEDKELSGIAGIPYLSEFDGGDWKKALYSWHDKIGDAQVIATHAPMFPKGKEPEGLYSYIDVDEWANELGYATATIYGHIHTREGVFWSDAESDPMQFCNNGALSRGSLHEETVNRKPAITYWDGIDFSDIEVPHLSPGDVFELESARAITANKESAKQFAEAIGKTELDTLTIESISDMLKASTDDPRVIKIIDEALENAQ